MAIGIGFARDEYDDDDFEEILDLSQNPLKHFFLKQQYHHS